MGRKVYGGKSVAPFIAGAQVVNAEHGNGYEMRWADSEFHTGVQAFQDAGTQEVTILRPGKGGFLTFDWAEAAHGMAPVRLHSSAGAETVAHLGAPHDGPVQVSKTWPPGSDYCKHCGRGGMVNDWTEYRNAETALVDLAFLHLS